MLTHTLPSADFLTWPGASPALVFSPRTVFEPSLFDTGDVGYVLPALLFLSAMPRPTEGILPDFSIGLRFTDSLLTGRSVLLDYSSRMRVDAILFSWLFSLSSYSNFSILVLSSLICASRRALCILPVLTSASLALLIISFSRSAWSSLSWSSCTDLSSVTPSTDLLFSFPPP